MNIIADLHTHTIASTHAYSTVSEMAAAARAKGLAAIAITDHGPSLPDSPHPWHFANLNVIPPVIEGVRVLRGIEFNIHPSGVLDEMGEGNLKWIEFALASFHEPCFAPSTMAAHTEALERVLHEPRVNAFGHLGNPRFVFDKEYVIARCNDFGKIVEINSGSFGIRKGSAEHCAEIARLCKKYEVPVVVDTDAHISYTVGHMTPALAMLDEVDFPEELVINSSRARLSAYFAARGVALFPEE